MKENENNPTQIKDYLIEKNKDLVDELVSAKFPIITAIGDKVETIAENLKDQTVERKRDKRGDFLKEAQKDKEIALEEITVNYLKDMAGILKTMQDDSGIKKGKDSPSEDKSFLSGIFGAGIGAIFAKLFSKKGLKEVFKKVGKSIFKKLGPIALLFGAFDFAKGFADALKITGRDDFSAKLQAGLSSVLSTITFGLIDAKTISETMDKIMYKIFDFIMDPIEKIKEFAKKFLIIDNLAGIVDTLTFGLISKKSIKEGVTLIGEKFQEIFIDPFVKLKKWWLKDFNMIELIENILSPMVLSITEGWNKIMVDVRNVFNQIIAPFEKIKEGWDKLNIRGFFDRMIDPLMSLKESIITGEIFIPLTNLLNEIFINPFIKIKESWDNLDIKGLFDRMINPLISLKDSILSGDIFAPLTEWFNNFDLIEFLGIKALLKKVKDFKENMIEILKSPKKLIMDFLGMDDEENEIKPKIYKQKITQVERKIDMPSKSSNALKEKYIQAMKSIKKEGLSENNNLNIVNSNTNNNIIMDDMSINSDDYESLAYAY